MFNKVLVPLDGSELAEAVLPHAESLARACRSQLLLLQVIPPASQVVGLTGAADLGPMTHTDVDAIHATMESETRKAQAYLTKAAERLSQGGLVVNWEVRQGPPGPSIVTCAQEAGADIIAISTHGRSGFGRLIFGSVADHVLRKAGVPILLIKPTGKGESS